MEQTKWTNGRKHEKLPSRNEKTEYRLPPTNPPFQPYDKLEVSNAQKSKRNDLLDPWES